MPDYRRYRVPGGTYFFTVNLLERRLDTLVRHIGLLREAARGVRQRYPLHIDACVVLTDHLHCLWTLPEGDADFSTRWRLIKTAFAKALLVTERRSAVRWRATNVPSGNGAFGNMPSAMNEITHGTWIISTTTR